MRWGARVPIQELVRRAFVVCLEGRRGKTAGGVAWGTGCIFRGVRVGSRRIGIGGAACLGDFPRCRGGGREGRWRRPRVLRCAGFLIRVPSGRVGRRRRRRASAQQARETASIQICGDAGARRRWRFGVPRLNKWREERARIFGRLWGGREAAWWRRKEKSAGAR